MRGVKHWNILSREAVDASFLETFKVRWNGALNNLAMARCWNEMNFNVAFSPNHSAILLLQYYIPSVRDDSSFIHGSFVKEFLSAYSSL